MIEARIASMSSMPSFRLWEVYSPLRSLITPGMRTKSTRRRNSKLPMIGEPDRISTDMLGLRSTRALAIARQRRKWPSPKRS
jgi:hypothetical protein